jgi:hypothetical protein
LRRSIIGWLRFLAFSLLHHTKPFTIMQARKHPFTRGKHDAPFGVVRNYQRGRPHRDLRDNQTGVKKSLARSSLEQSHLYRSAWRSRFDRNTLVVGSTSHRTGGPLGTWALSSVDTNTHSATLSSKENFIATGHTARTLPSAVTRSGHENCFGYRLDSPASFG